MALSFPLSHASLPSLFLRNPPLRNPWSPLPQCRTAGAPPLPRASLAEAPAPHHLDASLAEAFRGLLGRAEGALHTVADSAVATDPFLASGAAEKQSGDWLGGLSDGLEAILKVLKDGLSTLHVPYSYGFAIILLTILVKAATFPLTKKQVESTLAMQNLSPKIKAIQQRYTGDQERIQLETARLYKQAGVNPLAGCLPTLATIPVWIGLYRALTNVANEGLLTEGFFWIPSLGGPTSIASRQNGSGISWLFPFVDGNPPLGWSDTLSYLSLPLLLIISQYISMQIMQTPQTDDPNQKNTQIVLKFLPLMIGYFALSVPSGLSLYWLTNNILSTGQQVWLKKLGGAKPVVGKDGGGIISAGKALRTSLPSAVDLKQRQRGERFKHLKAAEGRKKAEKAEVARLAAEAAKAATEPLPETREKTDDEVGRDEVIDVSSAKDSLEDMYNRGSNGAPAPDNSASKGSKRSKRKRAV